VAAAAEPVFCLARQGTERLDGFLFNENAHLGRNWAPWLLWSLAVGTFGVLLVLYFNLRLRQKVTERTRELRDVEDRWLLAGAASTTASGIPTC